MSSESLGSRLVLDTQDGDVEELNQIVSKDLKAFRKRLRDIVIFIHDTRISKDQIRATIKCYNKLTDSFNNVLEASCGAKAGLSPIQKLRRVIFDDSEELSCDMLRSNALALFKHFRKVTLKSFVKAYPPFVTIKSDDAKKTLLAIQDVVAKGDNLVYRVVHEGFDCRSSSDDEDHSDDNDDDEDRDDDSSDDDSSDDDDDDDDDDEDSDYDDDKWVTVNHEVAPTEF